MLTEHEVARSWQLLFSTRPHTTEHFARAEALLEELRCESPLRHRLAQELEEIRSNFENAEKKAAKATGAKKPRKKLATSNK